jgi:quercetin dioxygenase-like cupin family protein
MIKNSNILLYIILFVFIFSCKPKQTLADPLQAGWNNQPVCEVLQDNAKQRILKCSFPPGVGHEKHYHNPHFGYTLKGSKFRITDQNGTKEVNVPSGSIFSKDEVTWHEVLNIGDSTAVFLIIEPKK